MKGVLLAQDFSKGNVCSRAVVVDGVNPTMEEYNSYMLVNS